MTQPSNANQYDHAALVRVIRRAAQRGRELREGQAAKDSITNVKNTDLPQPEAKNALD